MTPTLKQIEKSVRICGLFTIDESEDSRLFAFTDAHINFYHNAVEMFPATLKLVMEMYQILDQVVNYKAEMCSKKAEEMYGICRCMLCEARRLIEQMEEEK